MSERATRDAEAKPYTQAIGARGHATATRETDGKDPHDRSRAVGLTFFGSIRPRMSPRAKGYQSRALRWRLVEENERKHLVLCQKEIASLARAAGELCARCHDFHPLQADELAEADRRSKRLVEGQRGPHGGDDHALLNDGAEVRGGGPVPMAFGGCGTARALLVGRTGDPPSELAE